MPVFFQCLLAADFQDEGDGCVEPRVFDEFGNAGNRSTVKMHGLKTSTAVGLDMIRPRNIF